MKVQIIEDKSPESWNILSTDNDIIGNVWLNHGFLKVTYIPTNEVIYEANTLGQDSFHDSEERRYFINKAMNLLEEKHNEKV